MPTVVTLLVWQSLKGINVTVDSKPVDVMFVNGGGSLYTPTPTPQGYKIPNSDWYDIKNLSRWRINLITERVPILCSFPILQQTRVIFTCWAVSIAYH